MDLSETSFANQCDEFNVKSPDSQNRTNGSGGHEEAEGAGNDA